MERLASAGRALDKVESGLKLVDTVLTLGEGAGLPLLPAVCSAARGVLQAVQASRTVISDVLSAAQRTIDVLELLQLMAKNVGRMDGRASVEDRMRELQRLLDDVRSAVAAFAKKGWLRHALKRRNVFSQFDSEITGQLDLLLTFYNIARDAHIIDRLQAREYAVEAEVQRQVVEREKKGEAVDEDALVKDSELVRGMAVASGVSDADFRSELRELGAEVREAFEKHGLKLDKVLEMVTNLSMGGGGLQSTHSSRLSLYEYDRKPDAPPGQKLKLAARLGKGSFGVTYRMRKVAGIDARRYAVKLIESEELGGAVLEKEARLLSLLEHENLLRFYDAFWHDTDDSCLFVIVTELLTGGSLVEKIAAAPPPLEVAALMRQVASGLAYMHSLNLQHRDLKPANVMLDSTGRAKIIDFGLACVSSASRSRTKTKAVGTDAYMSPEKADGKRYGPPDDVWAAGCILAELLLGRPIGNVARDQTKMKRAIAESTSASERLGSWVEGCLQQSPGRRPAAAVLEQGLASGGPDVRDVPTLVAVAEAGDFAPLVALARDGTDGQKEESMKASVRTEMEAKELEALVASMSIDKPQYHFSWSDSGGPCAQKTEERRLREAAAAAAADEKERVRRQETVDRSRREAEERAQRKVAERARQEAATERAEGERKAAAEMDRRLREAEEDALDRAYLGALSDVGQAVLLQERKGWEPEPEEQRVYRDAADRSKAEEQRARQKEEEQRKKVAENSSSSDVPTLVAVAEAGDARRWWEAFAPLVALARCGTDGQKEQAAAALLMLADHNNDNKVAIARAGGIPLLVALVRDRREERAARALANLAGNADNKVAIAKAGGIEPLVALARDGTDPQKENAAGALRMLAFNNADNQLAIARAGGIPLLVALAGEGTDGQKEAAAGALRNLAGNADNEVAIVKAGGIAPLVALAHSGTVRQKEWAAAALRILARNADNQVAIARAGGILPMVALARCGTDGQKETAAWALLRLAFKNDDNKVAIANAGGIEPLVALARDGSNEQKKWAAGALGNLAVNNADNQMAIAKAGGIGPLVALARGGTEKQKEHAAFALGKLANNKTAKAAMKKAGW